MNANMTHPTTVAKATDESLRTLLFKGSTRGDFSIEWKEHG